MESGAGIKASGDMGPYLRVSSITIRLAIFLPHKGITRPILPPYFLPGLEIGLEMIFRPKQKGPAF
jgi:hypothetical protein